MASSARRQGKGASKVGCCHGSGGLRDAIFESVDGDKTCDESWQSRHQDTTTTRRKRHHTCFVGGVAGGLRATPCDEKCGVWWVAKAASRTPTQRETSVAVAIGWFPRAARLMRLSKHVSRLSSAQEGVSGGTRVCMLSTRWLLVSPTVSLASPL